MKIQLLKEECIACGLCQVLAPSIFDYDEEGIVLFAKQADVDVASYFAEDEEVLQAVRSCPTGAIRTIQK